MIKEVRIIGLYDSEDIIKLEMDDRLFILTGDNGAGKTTILNAIYYALNANFEWFYKINFKTIHMIFENNNSGLKTLSVKRLKNELEVKYQMQQEKLEIKLEKSNVKSTDVYFMNVNEESNLRKIKREIRNSYVAEHNYGYKKFSNEHFSNQDFGKIYFPAYSTMDELIDAEPKLAFIKEIRKSLLYFPTYRRIDNDIKNLIQNNIYKKNNRFYREIEELDNPVDLNIDRRVIGVGDEDIEKLYREYSDRLKEFNSQGLNQLLKEFVRLVIESLYSSDEVKNNEFEELKMLEKAPYHLLDLADKLNITDINREEVYSHYSRKKSNREKLASLMKEKEKDRGTFLIEEFIWEIENQSIVNELIQLYVEHLNKQGVELKPYHYLKSGFTIFFKNKLNIELNSSNYSLNLSKPFSKLSTGEKQLITIISYSVLAISKGSFKPLLIIDEPELSLHVSWQGKLINHLMDNNSTKLLLATHSPFIAKTDYFPFIHQLGDIDADY